PTMSNLVRFVTVWLGIPRGRAGMSAFGWRLNCKMSVLTQSGLQGDGSRLGSPRINNPSKLSFCDPLHREHHRSFLSLQPKERTLSAHGRERCKEPSESPLPLH